MALTKARLPKHDLPVHGNHSNHIHIFTPITRIVATTLQNLVMESFAMERVLVWFVLYFSENSRRLWACGCFRGLLGGSRGKLRESPGKIAGKKIFPNREMLQILGFWAPGKANLLGTLGPHCQDLVPTFRAGCFLKSTVPAFSSFSEFWSLQLRSRRPATGVSRALRARSVPRVSPECPGHLFDTPGTLSGHFLDTPERGARRAPGDTPSDTPSDTPHSRGHSRGHFGPEGPERLL